MQDWAFQCRTDVDWCQNQCNVSDLHLLAEYD
jgi:hypothetical protein